MRLMELLQKNSPKDESISQFVCFSQPKVCQRPSCGRKGLSFIKYPSPWNFFMNPTPKVCPPTSI